MRSNNKWSIMLPIRKPRVWGPAALLPWPLSRCCTLRKANRPSRPPTCRSTGTLRQAGTFAGPCRWGASPTARRSPRAARCLSAPTMRTVISIAIRLRWTWACCCVLDAASGRFLWQASSEKLASGRADDWPMQGISSRPWVEGDRLWYVTSRCEVVCLDTEGFLDHENDGPVQDEHPGEHEADVVWKLDLFNQLGVRPHEQSPCSPAADDRRLFVVTSNGVDQSHVKIPAPDAPSFVALDKRTGSVLWTDHSPGRNIMHSQWGSPLYAVLGGVPQVIFPGGDGWLYSFDPGRHAPGHFEIALEVRHQSQAIGLCHGRTPRSQRAEFFSLRIRRSHLLRLRPGSRTWRRAGSHLVHRSDQARRRERRTGGRSGQSPKAAAARSDWPRRPAESSSQIRIRPSCGTTISSILTAMESSPPTKPCIAAARAWRSRMAFCLPRISAATCIAWMRALAECSGRTICSRLAGARRWSRSHAYVCDEEGKVSIFRFPSRQPGRRRIAAPGGRDRHGQHDLCRADGSRRRAVHCHAKPAIRHRRR